MRQRIPQITVPRTPGKEDIRPFLKETPTTNLNKKRAAKDITNRNNDDDTNELNEHGDYGTCRTGLSWTSD